MRPVTDFTKNMPHSALLLSSNTLLLSLTCCDVTYYLWVMLFTQMWRDVSRPCEFFQRVVIFCHPVCCCCFYLSFFARVCCCCFYLSFFDVVIFCHPVCCCCFYLTWATLLQFPCCDVSRPYKVFRHKIGQPASEDVVVYEETDEVRCLYKHCQGDPLVLPRNASKAEWLRRGAFWKSPIQLCIL